MPYWACVQTAPARESAAEHFLRLAGYSELYVPRLRVVRRHHGRRLVQKPPLFPNYLFVWISAGWWAARWCPHVARIITNGGAEPARVSAELIESIRRREVNGVVELPRRSGLKPGDRVRVVAGALSGLSGLYVGMKPRERVEILLQMLGGQSRVELAASDVEAAVS